ncbi:related to GPI1-required for N-acetylglucosaminyl phosphatidylinositol synthesis [Sporisorium reilianum f. sp. reilianum]|uniref:Related to GPI1-required for N-acetylglucosaminyl phosphatidylinositol synthesis n=1 Tax=Sporisorium reilianum f. sp. reilianum TaxID=72559 RepID=A0A2N8U5E3_9BASI|nr:related to GPI1-required for N-acetylglucosaminyl phosphatidylinositol synthesis [Sporisorium reilianum f. sp. reilianum]
MPHFEEINTNTESSRLPQQQHADVRIKTAKAVPVLDVARVDTLLVFWPDKLVDLSHLVSAHAKETGLTLLVGRAIHGHSHEAAVVVVGSLQASDTDAASDVFAANRLSIVGSFSTGNNAQVKIDAAVFAHHSNSPVWLSIPELRSRDELPVVTSVRFYLARSANGHAGVATDADDPRNAPCAVSLVGYSVPNSQMLQYFALEALRLAPVSGMKLVSTATALLVPDAQLSAGIRPKTADSAPSMLENKFLQLLHLDPVHWRSFRSVRPGTGQVPRGTALRRAIEWINQLQALHEHLASLRAPSSSKSAGNGEAGTALDDVESNKRSSSLSRIDSAATWIALAVQGALRYSFYTPKERAVVVDGVARRPLDTKAKSLRLTSVSASARQLDVRISQLVVAPRLASRLRYLRKQQKLPIDEIAAPYIGLWNAIWLIANDIILGHAASVLLLQNKTLLAELVRTRSERYLLESMLWLLAWLENWPAGLKLNTELSLFFSDAYSSLTVAWHAQCLAHLFPRLESVIVAVALAGRLMGVTMVLCMVQDLVSMCTLHITVFYTLSFRTLRAFVYVLSSLFDVFRGKKRNALRAGRLDDASYELDQLLLGTLLFTLVAFLFPTVYVYYLAFGLARFGLVAFEAGVVETCLGLLNHLPLFALMLRVKDARRLPAGVWLQELSDTSALPTGRFRLRSRPLAVGDIFEGYGQHVGGLVQVPSMLLRCILGRPLRPAPSSE